MFSKTIFLLTAILFGNVSTIHSFSVLPSSSSTTAITITHTRSNTSSTSLNNFFKNAFANDDSLGKPENAGLKNVSQHIQSTDSWMNVFIVLIFHFF
jgi:hypothetical protein